MNWKLEEAVSYYKRQGAPADQTALTALLKEVQQEYGGSIPQGIIPTLATLSGAKESLLLALIRRLPSLHLGGSHVLELCAGPNCGKHAALAAAAEKLQSSRITVRFVPCMRMCGKGPNLRWDGTLYHKADEALLRRLAEEAEKGSNP